MPLERLDKILASTGKWSRKEAKELIRAGRILVDGVVTREAAAKFDPEAVRLSADDESVLYRRSVWVMLNKPAGYVSTKDAGKGPTVMDLLPRELRNLFPVGRLDKNTEGLLLLTNDGPAAHALLSPRHHVDKVYHARVWGRPTDADIAAFRAGLTLSDGLQCLPAELEILSDAPEEPGSAAPEESGNAAPEEPGNAGQTPAPDPRETLCRVTVREGKFHQVKRMFQQIGTPVRYLERVKMGNLPLDSGLARGSFRFLTAEEIEKLGIFS
ncbi:MAG: rRNA pseudouridine synthase [Oscillibacter sp.]|nr:rRNA pseudouridine synthase [Oscillibacter sp.]